MTCRFCQDRPGGCLACLHSARRVSERLRRQQAEAFLQAYCVRETTEGPVLHIPRSGEELIELVAAAMEAGAEYHGDRERAPAEGPWRRFEMLEMP